MLRIVRISWKSVILGVYPLFSTLFLIFSAGMATLMYTHQISPFFPIMACYVWRGFCWFVSSYFTSKSYITDHGIVDRKSTRLNSSHVAATYAVFFLTKKKQT